MSDFPAEFLRGVSNENDFLDSEGLPKQSLFQFSKVPRAKDGNYDLSITWRDNEEAVSIIMNQQKEKGGIQFKAGLAVLSREKLDSMIVIGDPMCREDLSYERDKKPENKYHGNIVHKPEGKERQAIFRAILAMSFVGIIKQTNPSE